jgi:hypothetical protein
MGRKDKNRPFLDCLRPFIVPEDRFLKIANLKFKCPDCGHESDRVNPYFLSLIKLKKAADAFDKSGFYIKNYDLAFQGCYEDGFDITPHVLEENDWIHWNMQISAITIANSDRPSIRIDLWEDHNFKARPFIHPFDSEMTFGSVLRRHSLFTHEHGINLPSLKTLIREIRNYNNAWLNLMDSFVTAAPVDLKHSLYTLLAKVESLDELFPDNEKYK